MTVLAREYRSTREASEPSTLTGFDRWCDSLIRRRGTGNILSALEQQADAILKLSETIKPLSNAQLEQSVIETRQAIRCGRAGGSIKQLLRSDVINHAFAQVAEWASRTLGTRPYQVQLMGALALHYGYATQMFTGEGKTLTAGVSACVAAWNGRPCHVITSNDYLAARDAELMAPLFGACGLTVTAVTGEMDDQQRRHAYAADIVYATSKELLADYLRDQMRRKNINAPDRRIIQALKNGESEQTVMRGLDTAIVDEADSVLVDDALTPLIISAPGENRLLKEASTAAHTIVMQLQAGVHYIVEPIFKEARLTTLGENFVDTIAENLPPLWRGKDRRLNILRQALLAREFYQRDRQYIIDEDGCIVIVDEKTGRSMPGRSWSYGLHQAIEAKEGVELSDPTETHTKLSFQRFFRRYRKLSGMSGTLQGLEKELWNIYRLRTLKIPSRLPSQRQYYPDRFFKTQQQKWQAVVATVQKIHASGQPVLVGTRSILDTDLLFELLQQHAIKPQVLNAHHHAQEAQIIARAGERGMVTIATNMAGRGTDIKITKAVEALGGLYVIATERHESSRVDYQLFGRSARQGQPGAAQAFLSLEDELFRQVKGSLLLKLANRLVSSKQNRPTEWVLRLFVHGLQRYMENQYSRDRYAMLQLEKSTEEMLSFVGDG